MSAERPERARNTGVAQPAVRVGGTGSWQAVYLEVNFVKSGVGGLKFHEISFRLKFHTRTLHETYT